MSGIMQRRPIILYETLEALYQQVNAPFCAQRREKFPARAARRCAPRQVRQLEEQMRPAADTARQELAALAARMQPSYDRWEGYFAGHTFAQLLESMTNQAVEEDGLENRVNLSLLAGTIAGNPADGTISGVAPQAQLVVMKVFGDKSTGAAEDDILAALEDCVKLGVDAVNLSLGSYGGFTVDEDALINDVYNKLDDAGIMVITAAGNETSSSYMNSYGTDAPLTGDPDNSVVAAPSVYPANLSIASVEGQEVYANYVLLGDEKITYTDSQTSFLGLDSYVSLLKVYGDVSDDLAAPYDYVMVPGYGADSDYEGIDVTGKIAVVQRGGTDKNGEPITFVTKIQNALWKNAIGILVYNNDTEHPDNCSIRMATNYYQLPAAFISYNAAQKLAA